jgi:Lar family restriction alleviation protein
MPEQLKPCPFCGGDAECDTVPGATGVQHFVSCAESKCVGFVYSPWITFARESDAIAAWNRRAGGTTDA